MIKWAYRKLPNGEYEGFITIVPTGAQVPGGFKRNKPIKLVARSRTKAGALAKASSVALKIANNPLLAAALPPGSMQAIKAISFLSKSAAAGKLNKAIKKFSGKGAKRLYKKLKKFW